MSTPDPVQRYLTEPEVVRMIAAAKKVGRYGHRDATMVLIAFRHGLRVSELVGLQWSQVDLDTATLYVRRKKLGKPSTHPIKAQEIRALRKLHRANKAGSPYVFLTERKGPMDVTGFNKIVKRAGDLAGIGLACHPHMLRHSCGHKLANDGQDTRAIQDYLGHRSIQSTVRYTELSPIRFKDFWED